MSEIKLTIDEVIEHCNRTVNRYYKHLGIEKIIDECGKEPSFVKEYLEHKQVAEWLKELKYLRGALERIVEQLTESKEHYRRLWNKNQDDEDYGALSAYEDAIDTVKEEGGIE